MVQWFSHDCAPGDFAAGFFSCGSSSLKKLKQTPSRLSGILLSWELFNQDWKSLFQKNYQNSSLPPQQRIFCHGYVKGSHSHVLFFYYPIPKVLPLFRTFPALFLDWKRVIILASFFVEIGTFSLDYLTKP